MEFFFSLIEQNVTEMKLSNLPGLNLWKRDSENMLNSFIHDENFNTWGHI